MANKMLIDASHPEETRVVVTRGNRVEEFDFESASKKQLRGNIYLAKVTRVEPSLQAAFVDYGGNRHGFLAFSEIHPDYYQIPVIDRQALIEEEARAQRDSDDDDGQKRSRRHRRDRNGRGAEKRVAVDETMSGLYERPVEEAVDANASEDDRSSDPDAEPVAAQPDFSGADDDTRAETTPDSFEAEDLFEAKDLFEAGVSPQVTALEEQPESSVENEEPEPLPAADEGASAAHVADEAEAVAAPDLETRPAEDPQAEAPQADIEADATEARRNVDGDDESEEEEHVEQLGGDAMEEVPVRPQRYRRQYKIQEVVKRRQVLLVQVVKEERGNKGAALTTYLSLAGRYSVLMPNTARGGGISRKITDSTDRQRLKSIAAELDVPEGMGVILRTAGASRTKAEVKRDFEYLLRMWETVRETTLKSTAPTLVYEEGSLIKRAIRDLYNKDIDEILVGGDRGYREARDFMRLLMPSHVNSVQPYREPQPIFAKSDVEAQLDALFLNHVTLKSGGYIIINQAEALVAIDVNSGRSTREHNIEDTAVRTNLEAADEVARQLRLRDLAGLIVVDFIDMEEGRNNRAVERRLKDALKNDRARIQIGRISHFGLLEMSRQRIRTGVLEGSTEICPHCSGSGILRSTASIALHVLRVVEDALIKTASHDLIVRSRPAVALYILNEKRAHLRDLERRFGVSIIIDVDDSLIGSVYHAIERGGPASGGHEPLELVAPERAGVPAFDLAEETLDLATDVDGETAESDEEFEAGESFAPREGESEADADNRRRRRRRRRRGRGADREGSGIAPNAPQPPDDALEVMAQIGGLTPAIREDEPAPAGVDDVESESGLGDVEETPEAAQAIGDPEAAPRDEEPDVESQDPAPAAAKPRRARRSRARDASPGEGDASPQVQAVANDAAEAEGTETAQPARRSRRVARARAPKPADAETAAPVAEDADIGAAESEPREATPVAFHESAPATDDFVEASSPRLPDVAVDGRPEATQAEPAPEEAAADRGAPEEAEAPLDPDRPKRSGWWQRAKASLGR